MHRIWIALLVALSLPALASAGVKEDHIRELEARIKALDAEIQRLEVPAINDRAHEIPRLWTLAHKLHERARQHLYLATETHSDDISFRAWKDPGLAHDLKASVAAAEELLELRPDDPPVPEVELFIARCHRFQGAYEDMIRMLHRVIDEHRGSPQATRALMLLGDFDFDKDQLDRAAEFYTRVIAQPGELCDAMARYKLGWIRINEARWPEAMAEFETIARGPEETPCIDELFQTPAKLELVEEALLALVFCYTEVHPPGQALDYFGRYQMSKRRAVRVYEKLANRLFIIEEFPAARMVYRHLLPMTDDPEQLADWKQRLADIEPIAPAK